MDSARKLIFLHLPKTGGTSLVRSLEAVYPEKQRAYIHGDEDSSFATQLQQQRLFLHGHFSAALLPQAREADYFSFSLVRDPVSRGISRYLHLLHSDRPKHQAERALYHSFEDYMESAYAQNWQSRSLSAMGKSALSDAALWRETEAAARQLDGWGLTEKLTWAGFSLRERLGLPLAPPGRHNTRPDKALWYRLYERYGSALAERNAVDAQLYAWVAQRQPPKSLRALWRYWTWRLAF